MSRVPGRLAVRPRAGARSLGRRALFAVLALAVLLPSACLSPTLPLPPPSRPDTIEGPDQNGYVRLTGTVAPNSRANAMNRRTSSGVFDDTADDGHYDMMLQALAGDEIVLWYTLQGENSQAVRFQIPLPPP
jgi:hypothetical protein